MLGAEQQGQAHRIWLTDAENTSAVARISLILTSFQPIHMLQPDDVPFVKVEQSPVLVDEVSHRHHIL